MSAKKKILDIFNSFIKKSGFSINRIGDRFDMDSAIKRISAHKIPINTVIDIGASNGKWSISVMPVFPKANFLAIEPLKERNSELERCSMEYDKFDFELCVAGENDNEEVILNVSNDLDGSTVNGSDGIKRKVTERTIDSLVKEKGLKGPFLIKFDTHGFEVPIIKGATETLKETNVIIMEVYNYKITKETLLFYEMCKFLKEVGFSCYDVANPMLRLYDNSFWQMDMFFAKEEFNMFKYNDYK